MLRDITIGRYIRTDSPLHRADARTKLICAAAYSAAVIICRSSLSLGLLTIFTIAAILISGLPPGYTIKGLKPLRWFILLTAIMNLFSEKGNIIWQWQVFHITDMGIITAVLVSVRFILFITGTSLLTLTTPPIALTDGLARLMRPLTLIKIPIDDIAMIISITLRFIPVFADNADRIMKAQRARGSEFNRKGITQKIHSVIAVTIPLFHSAFRHADELSVAMETRCYGKGTRHPRKKSRFGIIDAQITGFMLLFFIFLAFIEFYH